MTDAVETLRAGAVIVMPTDTVYGLACLPRLHSSVNAIFELKGRPDEKALPVLGSDLESLEKVAVFDDRARSLVGRFWPGALTLVLKRAAAFDHDLGGNELDTVAVRVPQNKVALDLLKESGPLAVTSANRSGEAPATSVGEAKEIFGDRVAVYVDGGPCRGLPSTVVSLVGAPQILREGAVRAHEVLW